MIKAILACDDKGGVAKGGTLPWPNNSRDLKWYKEHTTNNVIVMGSTTWQDPHMPCPMPNRVNVVVSSNTERYLNEGANYAISSDNPRDLCEQIENIASFTEDKITWIIGGPKIIEQTLPIIEEFYISRIPGDYNCDTFLPLKKIDTLFEKSWEKEHPEVTFQIWKRKKRLL